MEEVLLCEKVATIHTEMMTRCLASEVSKHLFLLLRNRKAKLTCLWAAAHGKHVYENIVKHEATTAKMEDALIAPLPHQEFHWVTHRPRNWSRSPLRGSHSPKPCPGVHVARTHVVPTDTTTTSTEAANVPLLSHMHRLPKEDSTTAPPDKPTIGVPNYQPPTTGTPSHPPPTVQPHHCSSCPENSRASEPSFIGQIAHVCISNSQGTITQETKNLKWKMFTN